MEYAAKIDREAIKNGATLGAEEPAIKDSLTGAEPVAWEHHEYRPNHEYRPYGAPEIRIHAILASKYTMADGSVAKDFQWLIDQYKADKNTIKLLPLYAAPPRREWVGLTDADFEKEKFVDYNFMAGASFAEAKLREKNT